MTGFSTIRLNAGNDYNGNPRRVYVVFRGGAMVAAYDEGYAGPDAITNRHHRKAWNGHTIRVTPGEYRQTVKRGEEMRRGDG